MDKAGNDKYTFDNVDGGESCGIGIIDYSGKDKYTIKNSTNTGSNKRLTIKNLHYEKVSNVFRHYDYGVDGSGQGHQDPCAHYQSADALRELRKQNQEQHPL